MSAAVQRDREPLQVAQRRVLILGLARSGRAAAELLHAHGAQVIAVDEGDATVRAADEAWASATLMALHTRTDASLLDDVALVVLSPGIPRTHAMVRAAETRRIPVLSEIEVAYRFSKAPVIAITGSKGKSTTTALVGHLLQAAGVTNTVAGNIGRPYASVVEEMQPESWVVLELSSFQLESMDRFHANVAVQLQLSPDHLDRYESFEAYARSKSRIAGGQTPGDLLVIDPEDAWGRRLAERSNARVVGFAAPWRGVGVVREADDIVWCDGAARQTLARVDDVPLLGTHNLRNSMAAIAVVRGLGFWQVSTRQALHTFEGLDFRMQDCGAIRGIRFVNDAKSTTVESVRAAVEGLPGPLLLAMGGRNKGLDFRPLAEVLVSVRRLFVFGEAAAQLTAELGAHVEIETVADVQAVVGRALEVGQAGETLLFSPGCTSFDQFHDAEERGRAFAAAVRAAHTTGQE